MDRGLDFSLSELIAVAPKTNQYREKIHSALREYFFSEGRTIANRKKKINNAGASENPFKGQIEWTAIYDDLSQSYEFGKIIGSWNEWESNLIQNSSKSPPGGSDKYHVSLLYWMHLPRHLIWNTEKLNQIADELCRDIFKMPAAEKIAEMQATKRRIQQSPVGSKPTLTSGRPTSLDDRASNGVAALARKLPRGLAAPHYLSEADVDVLLRKNPLDSVWLSPHNHHSIPLIGRDRELDRLNAFVDTRSPETFLVLPLVAPSGAGKTRLVSEWMKPLTCGGGGWDAGFVISREAALWSEENWRIERNTLIIIDYTLAYDDVVTEIARRALANIDNAAAPKIRLLVIDHIYPKALFSDPFWSKVFARKDEQDLARAKLILDPIELEPERVSSTLLANVIRSAANLDGKARPLDDPEIVAATDHLFRMGEMDAGGNDAVRHPLFAALVGQAIREAGNRPVDFGTWTRRDLIDRYFTGPLRFPWHVGYDNKSRVGIDVGALVSAATLRRGLRKRHVQSLKLTDVDAALSYAKRIVSSDDDNAIRPFKPDILGEAFVLEFFKIAHRDENSNRVFLSALSIACDDKESLENSFNVQETISRLARNLANDDQTLLAVEDSWGAVCEFLKPERFEDGSQLRLTISSAIADVMAELSSLVVKFAQDQEIFAKQDRMQLEHTLNCLNDVSARLETQFSKKDIEVACALDDQKFRAVYAGFKFFEFSNASNLCINQNFLTTISNALLTTESVKLTGRKVAAVFGFTKALHALRVAQAEEDLVTEYDVSELMICSMFGHTEAAALLLDQGAAVNRISSNKEATALIAACTYGHTETAELLLNRGAEVDLDGTLNGQTALMAACDGGYTAVATLLVDRGAKVNRSTTDLGHTALIYASARGHIEAVKLLLDRDANVDQGTTDIGWVALMSACLDGHTEIAAQLLERGADIDRGTTDDGATALMIACDSSRIDTVSFLLERGAKVNARKTGDGRTALDHSLANDNMVLTELLRCVGAKTGAELDEGRG